jgi:predicted transcriptional regulator
MKSKLIQENEANITELMRPAVSSAADIENKHEAFRQDALNAWDKFCQSGLHVTGDEADAWLNQLAGGMDCDIPQAKSKTNSR